MNRRWVFTLHALILLLALISLGPGRRPQEQNDASMTGAKTDPPVLQLGEELEYRVSYSFFTIGTIRFKITDREERDGRVVYRAHTFIDSNPSLSWLADVHIRFYGEMDEASFSYSWIGDDSTSSGVEYRMIQFDYPNNKMYYSVGRKDLKGNRHAERIDTVVVQNKGQDGLSLFFYARDRVRQKKKETIPTFIDNKEVLTHINFLFEKTDMDIDAVDYPVDVIHFDGRADFTGVFGLTGGFEGWFSNDDARIPITARMKVILGSIKVELVKWKRGNWTPPRFAEQE